MISSKACYVLALIMSVALQAVSECPAGSDEAQTLRIEQGEAILAARAAEAHALELAPQFSTIEEYADDIYDGSALMASYQGETKDGVYSGYGVLTLPDSNIVLAGVFANGLLNGPGVERDMQGTVYFEGTFKDGLPIFATMKTRPCKAEPQSR